jgi:predicted dehydrogenase
MMNGCHVDILVKDGKAPASSMAHFVESIVNDTPHIATGEEGLVIMQILDAIYLSAAKGGAPITLD